MNTISRRKPAPAAVVNVSAEELETLRVDANELREALAKTRALYLNSKCTYDDYKGTAQVTADALNKYMKIRAAQAKMPFRAVSATGLMR